MAQGLYLEQIEVGRTYSCPRTHTVREEDAAAYAALTGDYNPLHLDEAHAAKSPLGRRTAHGMLAAGVLAGMAMETLCAHTAVKLLDARFTFPAPVDFGDRLRGEFVPRSTHPSMQNPARGTLDLQCTLRNDEGAVVAEGILTVLMETLAARDV